MEDERPDVPRQTPDGRSEAYYADPSPRRPWDEATEELFGRLESPSER
ncbi:MAG TPA: hypothetical protein VF618_15525 [Thermoanaerobaculia bacterium]